MPESVQTNGHATNGTNGTNGSEEQVTKAFTELVVNTSQNAITPNLVTKLKALLLDYFGVSSAAGFAAESTPKILAGVNAFAGSSKGNSSVFTKGSSFAPQYAALLNGALCHTYDFDDTHANGILHPGCAVVSAALAQAEVQNASGPEFFVALTVGYEVACRLGMALNTGSYKRGFHNTATAGVFGAVAAICKLKSCPSQVVEDAFGLALSRAGGSMQFLENGSYNKRLHPGFAAHDAFLCVALAEAGVLGAAKPFEGKYGATALFSDSGTAQGMTTKVGTHWVFLDTACKPFPACRMTHGALEMVGKFTKAHGSKGLPKKITVTLPKANHPIVGLDSPNKVRPVSIVDAQFSMYYQVSAAWIHGNNLGWAIYEHIRDERVLDFCKRITCDVDEAYLNLESRMKVEFDDGTVAEDEVIFPIAEPQKPFEWDTGVQRKFLGMATPVYGEEGARKICEAVDGIEGTSVVELMKLLA